MKISHLISGGLITNYVCSSQCAHCLYECGPRREREYITEAQVGVNLRKARSLGCRSVHIGGGEPFLDIGKLKDALKAANSEKVAIEYVETNSSWVTNDESTIAALEDLMGLGVRTLLVSVSPFHNEFIPFRKVEKLISLCATTGMNVFPWMDCFIDEVGSLDKDSTHSLDEYEKKFGAGYMGTLPRRYGLTLRGRALSTFRKYMKEYSADEIAEINADGCSSLENTNHFHLDLYGGYIPGLCTGFLIGIEDLGGEVPQTKYPLLTLLHEKGISKFLEYAVGEFGFYPEGKFVSKCELCFKIRDFIVKKVPDRFKELAPAGFYKEG